MAGSSGALAVGNNQVVTGRGNLFGVEGLTNGTDAVVVTVYDGTDANGTLLWRTNVKGADLTGGFLLGNQQGIIFATGLFIVVAGTEGKAVAIYKAG